MEEIWKDIKDYEGFYQISNLGNVKSLKRIINGRWGKTKIKEKILKERLTKKGYVSVALYKNGKSKTIKVHRLVAQTFIPNIKNLPQVNHIDGNKKNNSVNNLEWCTCKENIHHSFKIGLRK